MELNHPVFQAVTFAMAVLGAALGLINTYLAIDKSRVKLRVVPKHAIPVGSAAPSLTFCIEVTNLSAFAVTIEEVGVQLSGTTHRVVLDGRGTFDGGWPRRLEPRMSVTVYSPPPRSQRGARLKTAYATTACGVTRTGSSPAFRQLAAAEQ